MDEITKRIATENGIQVTNSDQCSQAELLLLWKLIPYAKKFGMNTIHCQYSITEQEYCDWVYDKFDGDIDAAEDWAESKDGDIQTRYSYEKYRLDFLMCPADVRAIRINVELDGKEFHDYEADWERDRYMRDVREYDVIRIPGVNLCNGTVERVLDYCVQEWKKDGTPNFPNKLTALKVSRFGDVYDKKLMQTPEDIDEEDDV